MEYNDGMNKMARETTSDEDFFNEENKMLTKDKKSYKLDTTPNPNDENTIAVDMYSGHTKIYYQLQSDTTTTESNDEDKTNLVSSKQKETTEKLNDSKKSDLYSAAVQKEKESSLQLEMYNKLLNKSKNDKSELSDQEKETLKQMDEYQKEKEEFEENQKEYLIRGAMMKCTHGSHYRRLNLPKSHGVYTKDRPLMNETDSLEGDEHNIPTFGICDSCNNKTGNSVLLKKDVPRDKYGKPTGKPSPGEIRGIPCSPVIISNWMCPNEASFVEGSKAITVQSFLVCKYEGIIEVVDSGQNDDETAITEDSKA